MSAGLSPNDAINIIAGRETATTPLTRHEATAVELNGAGTAGPGHVIRAGSWSQWAYVIQDFGGISAGHAAVEMLSRTTRTLGLSCANASAWICYAEDGHVLSSFDPLFPDQNYGRNPSRLIQLAGEYPGDGARAESYASRLQWLESGLPVGIPSSEAEEKLPAARIDLTHLIR